jgi:hypothetical protein
MIRSQKENTMTNRFNLYQTAKLALVAGVMALAPSLASAQQECSASSLKGAYAFGGSGFNTMPGPPAVLTASNQVGVATFDGAGKLNIVLTGVSSFGVTPPFTPVSGTYTVNPDCTGLIALKFSDAYTSHAAFALGGSGKTIYAIVLDAAPNTNSLTFTRIHRNFH